MRWTIEKHGETSYGVLRDGVPVARPHKTYPQALSALVASAVPALTAAGNEAALLPEAWDSPAGVAFSTETGDGRNFTNCTWSWRDPGVSLVPLMFQKVTDIAHFSAELAGFVTAFSLSGTTVHAEGRFYDSTAGAELRDVLSGSERFGVSVDPGAVDAEWICVDEDEDGWCIEDSMEFLAYQVIGITATPFPGFADASISLSSTSTTAADDDTADETDDTESDTEDADAEAARVPALAAAGSLKIPARPPRAWLTMAEPEYGDPLLVEQPDEYGQPSGHYAVPTTIGDDGQVFGHMAFWGQCHTGYVEHGVCVEPPHSPSGYAECNLMPLHLDDGSTILTGPLVVGCDHADLDLFAPDARDHYANAGLAWADVHVVDGVFGPWFCGALRPGITEDQLRVLRASSVSGDWRPFPQGLDLILGLTVNGPGFKIRGREHEMALAASGIERLASRQPRARITDDKLVALVAANVVRPKCTDCESRRRLAKVGAGETDESLRLLKVLEARTRHLVPAAAAHAARRLARTPVE